MGDLVLSHSGIKSSQTINPGQESYQFVSYSLNWFGITYCASEKGFIKCPSAFLSRKMAKWLFSDKLFCYTQSWKEIDHPHFEVETIALRYRILSLTSADKGQTVLKEGSAQYQDKREREGEKVKYL
jgi:hypothetical protein